MDDNEQFKVPGLVSGCTKAKKQQSNLQLLSTEKLLEWMNHQTNWLEMVLYREQDQQYSKVKCAGNTDVFCFGF